GCPGLLPGAGRGPVAHRFGGPVRSTSRGVARRGAAVRIPPERPGPGGDSGGIAVRRGHGVLRDGAVRPLPDAEPGTGDLQYRGDGHGRVRRCVRAGDGVAGLDAGRGSGFSGLLGAGGDHRRQPRGSGADGGHRARRRAARLRRYLPRRGGAGVPTTPKEVMMSPRPARISREDVLAAALDIVDQGGLDRLTMRALGAALGVDPMAVYRLFSGKSAVTAALADQFWAGWRIPPRDPVITWQEYAITLMTDVRRRLCAHPHLIPVIATHPMSSPAALLVADEAVGR